MKQEQPITKKINMKKNTIANTYAETKEKIIRDVLLTFISGGNNNHKPICYGHQFCEIGNERDKNKIKDKKS